MTSEVRVDLIDVNLLLELNQSIPRYTSYPTAPEWGTFLPSQYEQKLSEVNGPVSLYLHIPFCHSMCLYCGCSVVLNRRPENEERYVQYLFKEIDLVSQKLKSKKVNQLHFGGGTPTKLNEAQFDRIFEKLTTHFDIDFSSEVAIEIDPRTALGGKKLAHLKKLGFNRVSFGVQDTNPKVQEAVRRYQSYEVTRDTFYEARALGFKGINIDLIYGLPFQTVSTFRETARQIIELKPDRIALFSYAKVPWLKPHQKAIKDETLPATEEKFQIYVLARTMFCEAGYIAIGMDHFAKKDDELAKAYEKKTLARNFQGYTVFPSENMLGFGITSIGHVQNAYVQNIKELDGYYQALDERRLPCVRGKELAEDDLIRRRVIQRLMCNFYLDKREVSCDFDEYFQESLKLLEPLAAKGLVANTKEAIVVTKKGELFIRNIASCFDLYLHQNQSHQNNYKQFSKSI